MELLIAFLLAYLTSGISLVMTDLGTPPLHRPGWAQNPSIGKILLNSIIWFLRPFTDQYYMNGQLPRAIAFGLLNLVAEFSGLFALFWFLIDYLPEIIGSGLLHVIIVAVTFLIGIFFLPALVTLLVLPFTFVVSIPLNIIFPIKKQESA